MHVLVECGVHSHERVYAQGTLLVASEVEKRHNRAGPVPEARQFGKPHGVVMLYVVSHQRSIGSGQTEPQEMKSVAHNGTVQYVG